MHVESFVCIVAWRNGTRCRDGVKILWHHCHPFVQKTFFLRLVLFSFVCLCFFLGMVNREDGKGGPKGKMHGL